MAREPELSIKVKVDPQIKPDKLKSAIEKKVKDSKEIPEIEIKPDEEKLLDNVKDALKDLEVPIIPKIDTAKVGADLQKEIGKIKDLPEVTIKVNVDNFSNSLDKRLKEELKQVNEKLNYYLKNLTTNTAGLNSVVEGLFPNRGISNEVQRELKKIQTELATGLKGTKEKIQPFKATDLFKIDGKETTFTVKRVKQLVSDLRKEISAFDENFNDGSETLKDGFDINFKKIQEKARETQNLLSALKSNLSSEEFKKIFNDNTFDTFGDTQNLTPLIKKLKDISSATVLTGDDWGDLVNKLEDGSEKGSQFIESFCDNAIEDLDSVARRANDIISDQRNAIEAVKEMAKTLDKAIKDDDSGYLSDAEIKTYGAAFDEVLSGIATKQGEINTAKQKTIELEDSLLAKTRSNREALRQELEEYKKLLKSFGVRGNEDDGNPKGKPKPKSKEPDKTPAQKPAEEPKAENQDALNNGIAKIQAIIFDINQEELQKSIDTIFAKVSAPIGFKPANGAIANIKQQLQEAFNDVVILGNSITKDEEESGQNSTPLSTSISGKVTITDADVIVDVKNPVSIPGTVTVDPTSVQFGNSDDLQKNASALSSVKQSLSKISTSAEDYGTKIAAIGPSVQYVAQEVDNLSKSLENQITDLDLITKKTDAYGTTANSVTLNTKDVAVAGDPVNVPVKATLKKAAITVPKEAVDIKVKGVLAPEDVKQTEAAAPQKPTEVPGHVTLSADDVVAPTAPVDIPGKVTLKVEDVTPPKGSVKIPGKVELKVSDITPPKTAVELEGKVSNITVDDSAKGKKKNAKDDVKKPEVIDLKGKVELKDEDIKRPNPLNLNGAIKIKAADVKIDDVEISKKKFDIKGNLILKNAEIADAVKEAVGKESKNKNDSESTQKVTTAKKKSTSRRGLISDLTTVNKKIAETKNMLDDVSEDEVGTIQKRLENLRANRDEIVKLLNDTNTDSDKWYVDRKFRYANKEVDYTRLRHADSKSVKESQENIQAAQNERDKYNNEKLSAYRAYRSEQNTYKLKKARLGEDEKSDEAIAINNAISELDTKKKAALNSMKLTVQEHTDLLDQMGKEDNEVEEKVNRQISIIKGHESNKNKVAQTTRGKKITDQLSAAQKTYGTEEEANATGKIPTSIQKALSVQQQLVDKIAKAKVGTEEYDNAIQAAEENWKSVVAIIDTAEKKQKDLTKAVDSIEKKFYQLAEEVSGSSNEKLKNSINGVITKAATLSAQNPNTYENYAVDYNELKRESYKANAQYTIWKSNYKKLEREGIKIAEGVEVARQMQADGSLQNVKFDGIDNLLKQLNELEPQTDAYKEKLIEVKKIWEDIERKVKAVEEAEKQAAKRESTKAANLTSVGNAISQNRATMKDVQKNYGTNYSFYGKLQEKDSKLKTLLDKVNESSDPVSAAKEWAKNNLDISPDSINSVTDAINRLNSAYREATQEAKDFNKEASRERSINKASMEVANLKATIHDYIAEHKKLEGTDVGKSLYELLEALNQSDAPEKIGELKKKYAELRAESKKLGLESKNLLDVFEKLFGQHLSTMITMAALHKMQDALRVVYQNVVEIDTAVTELRKVSEYTGKSLEEYMGRAAEQAQKLGVSISDYVNSTADWKRLGYSDEDAENLATYSTLLKNVGDNIDDVNTSSSYLISTLQGFGLLADQAEDVVNKIDAVANTQPVTAKDLGEILTRSSAAMSAANNTLEETIALGTAANAVIQDADTVGTTLKSLSMYLRAAKSDAENAGIEVDGMANSVSELRSELKSLTGVDIMLDSKNFKSTYQIMKELSQVWSGLSDVTQANVTEMIGGKRNANAVSAILNNFDVAESAMESAANSAGTAWEENSVWMDSIQGRLAQLDASFQVLSQDVLSSGLLKTGVSFLTSIVKLLDKIINLTGALPAGLGITAFAAQLGKPKMTGFMIVPSNTPGGDTEQACGAYYIKCCSAREYLVKPTNMVA